MATEGNMLEISLIYHQLFAPERTRMYRGCNRCIDEAVQDVQELTDILKDMSEHMPGKEYCVVGLNNCETVIDYKIPVDQDPDLTVTKEFLDYILDLEKDKQPLFINIYSPSNYNSRIEGVLNQHGKTLSSGKAKPRDYLDVHWAIRWLIKPLAESATSGTLVRDLEE